jgi:hypothetical protein
MRNKHQQMVGAVAEISGKSRWHGPVRLTQIVALDKSYFSELWRLPGPAYGGVGAAAIGDLVRRD